MTFSASPPPPSPRGAASIGRGGNREERTGRNRWLRGTVPTTDDHSAGSCLEPWRQTLRLVADPPPAPPVPRIQMQVLARDAEGRYACGKHPELVIRHGLVPAPGVDYDNSGTQIVQRSAWVGEDLVACLFLAL